MKSYQEKITIKSYQTDMFGKASVTALFHLMLDAAWSHAGIIDWGYDDLKSHNLFWVLSRFYMRINRYPEWQEQLLLSTWSSGTDGMFAYRGFTITDSKGELILNASSAWLILDNENHKIFRLSDYKTTFPKLLVPDSCRNPERVKPCNRYTDLSFSSVLFSDLDFNGHLNSVKYAERIIDHFGPEFMATHELDEWEANYLKEGTIGDMLAVSRQLLNDENRFQNDVIRESDGVCLCATRSHWRKRL